MATGYGAHYETGGFGYGEKRERLRGWLRANHIERFGLTPGTLLDVGCGDGFWAGLFADEGFEVSGFDQNAGAIAIARESHPSVRFEVGDAQRAVPFAERFDVVFVRNLSHFLLPNLYDAATVIRVVSGSLAPGGSLLLSQFSRRDGLMDGVAISHPMSAYVAALEPSLDVRTAVIVDDYVLVAARRKA